MRTAERAKLWTIIRDVPKREVQLQSFTFSKIPGVQDGEITFYSPITAICGVNGTGKSSLLRSIWATLKSADVDGSPEIKERLRDLEAELKMWIGGKPVSWRVPATPSVNAEDFGVLHVDPSAAAASLQRKVCGIVDLAEILEPLAPIVVGEKELELLSFVLNKRYESASICEVDDYPDHAPFPVIQVSENGVAYDIRTMSLGEISVFTMFWALHRVEKNSLVLLEEPETFLSPVSQGAFFDYLASLCVKKQLTLVLTTHSPQMFARLAPNQVQFTYRTLQGAKLADQSQFEAMRRAVGITPQVDLILLVEDRHGRELTTSMLRRFDHSLLLKSEVVDVGGLGEISRICETFPQRVKSVKLIGVYDGDSREELAHVDVKWLSVFLPNDEPAEAVFRAMIESDPDAFAQVVRCDISFLEVSLGRITGLNYHDWYEDLAKELGLTYTDLMSACFSQWCNDTYNEASAVNFIYDLRAAVGGDLIA